MWFHVILYIFNIYVCIIFIRSQCHIRNLISLRIFLVVLKQTRMLLKVKLLHVQISPLTSSPMQNTKLITGSTLSKEHHLPKLFNTLINRLPCIPYVGLCQIYQDWQHLLTSSSESYFMSSSPSPFGNGMNRHVSTCGLVAKISDIGSVMLETSLNQGNGTCFYANMCICVRTL